MKFTGLPLLLFLFFVVPGMAQFQLAPITGVNVSKLRASIESYWIKDRPTINRFMGGLNIKYILSDHFNIQMEGAYSQKGTAYETQYFPDMPPIRSSNQMNFIDLSTFGEYRLSEIYALNAGASYGINVGEIYDGQKTAKTIDTKNDTSFLAGLRFYMGQFFLRTTYQHGLNSLETLILADENGMDRGQTNGYNQTFQIAIGYYFL